MIVAFCACIFIVIMDYERSLLFPLVSVVLSPLLQNAERAWRRIPTVCGEDARLFTPFLKDDDGIPQEDSSIAFLFDRPSEIGISSFFNQFYGRRAMLHGSKYAERLPAEPMRYLPLILCPSSFIPAFIYFNFTFSSSLEPCHFCSSFLSSGN